MPALELLTGFVTAPSTTLTGLTMASGNSLTIRSAPTEEDVRLLNIWNDNQTAGLLSVRSPRMHDNVNGIRLEALASTVAPLIPWQPSQRLVPQDTLVAQLSGSGTASDIETMCMLIYYSNLPGINASLITADELTQRFKALMATENTLALGTSGGYSGEEAVNAEQDQFKANTPYALVGYIVSAECAAVRWRGSDIGNLGVGGPGNESKPELTKDWFVKISAMSGLPLIPVFQSENINNVLIDGAQDENGTDVLVSSIFAELSS